jgi:hypothetical protein
VTTYLEIDNAIWDQVKGSADPIAWAQYYVSTGSAKNRALAKALLVPIFGDPKIPGSSALDRIHLTGKFSGDQTQTVERAGNGGVLKSSGQGAELYTFQMSSATLVAGVDIPKALFPTNYTFPRNVAFWIRYRGHILNTNTFTDWLGDPQTNGSQSGEISPGSGYVIKDIEFQVMGPYAQFFEKPSASFTPAGTGGASQLTFSLKPQDRYASFMALLTEGYAK